MNCTGALTGMLPAIILVSAALTAGASLVLLRLYRRAVLRSMAVHAGADAPAVAPPPVGGAPASPLAVIVAGAESRDAASDGEAVVRGASGALRRAGGLYLGAGILYAAVMATPWAILADGGFPLARILWLLTCYAWPAVLALDLVAVTGARQRVVVGGAYLALLVAVGAYALSRNPALDVGQLGFFWLFANGPATLLLLAFLNRRVRAVGPLVLAFMVAGVTGAALAIDLVGNSRAALETLVALGKALGLGATGLFVLIHAAGFAGFAMLGWRALGSLGRWYRAKRLSDQALTLDAMMLLFAVVQSITLAFEGCAWVLTGLVAFAAWKGMTSAAFALLRRRGGSASAGGRMLLLLRVFSLKRRSERLFDALAKRWRQVGTIALIAGPDLATSVVEPHEFLEFIGGRLSRQFVRDDEDLGRRLRELDLQRDPDGRFRVNEFFCYADTWQMTMRRLAEQSDAVLMDLRSFSAANQGCAWELQQLVDFVPLERVVFVIDDSTDHRFLERALHQAWAAARDDSPNRHARWPAARLLSVEHPASATVDALLRLLTTAGDGRPRPLLPPTPPGYHARLPP
jgi:hypothetical protein